MSHPGAPTPPATPGRATFVLLIWPELQRGRSPRWRGALETARGERHYFGSLAELARLVRDMGGWADAFPEGTGEKKR